MKFTESEFFASLCGNMDGGGCSDHCRVVLVVVKQQKAKASHTIQFPCCVIDLSVDIQGFLHLSNPFLEEV